MKKLLILLFSIGLLFSLNFVVKACDYVEGEIVVGFNDGVSEEEAKALVKSYNLNWNSRFSNMFHMWVKVIEGNPDSYINDLEASSIVLWAEERGYSNSDFYHDYLLVQYNNTATPNKATELINSFNNLEIEETGYPPNWGIINVPVGEEEKWIKQFEKEEIVKYAEKDYSRSIFPTVQIPDSPNSPMSIFARVVNFLDRNSDWIFLFLFVTALIPLFVRFTKRR